MPELPEVETVVNDLRAAGLEGRVLRGVRVRWPRTVAPDTPAQFRRRLHGARITLVRRRAKFIVCELSSGELLLTHLRMTGRLEVVPAAAPHDVHERVIIALDDGRELRFHDPRKFGRMHCAPRTGNALDALGPEPLDTALTARAFQARMAASRRMLKPLLLDQTFIAGLGNIYVDEALWRARLHPCRSAAALTSAETRRLLDAIRIVLRRGIRNLGTSLGDGHANFSSATRRKGRNQELLRVYQQTGAPCARCATPVTRIVVGQRGTHLCPRCQPRFGVRQRSCRFQ